MARTVGKLRLLDKKLTNPIGVGDHVQYEMEVGEETNAIITGISPRKNYIVRQSPHNKHLLHLIAANIDQALLIVTVRDPMLKPGFIDRFLMMTEPQDIPVIIALNKSDLYEPDEIDLANTLCSVYKSLGYQAFLTSVISGEGLLELKEALQGSITLLSGQSGVGKSSLVNALEPNLTLRTGELSDHSGKGQHTTTFAEMLPLDGGGAIIDTPGIKSLSFNNLEILDVVHNFREIFKWSSQCKYNNCTHRNEPHCAVKKACVDGYISEIRYDHYIQILSEIEEQNHWQRKKDV